MHDDELMDDLPEPGSALQMLLDASPSPNPRRKRASSCPPTIEDVGMHDIVAKVHDFQMTEPKTDPVFSMSDDSTNTITAENAQTFLDPRACLFVGK
jgi:hypothetical protein